MLNIKNIELLIALEDGEFTLCQKDRTISFDKVEYVYSHEERKISATVTLEKLENITVGSVAVNIENYPFRENYNLSGTKPIRLTVSFDEEPEKLCATYQQRDWWSRPAFINKYSDIPDRTQALFLKGKETYGFILPMVGSKTKSYLEKGTEASVTFTMTAYTEGMNQVDDLCFILSEGRNLYQITEQAFQMASELKNVPMKKDRLYPEMFEYFGWCSWDAFYTDISETKVLDKVEELKNKLIPVRWLLMDDGWLNTEEQCLKTLEPDPTKFPSEFKDMIHKIKQETQITWTGVWHAFGGYWGGITPNSKLALDQKDHLYQTKNGKLLPHYLPEKGFGFWRDWYTYLKDQGIDFVKVDGQSALKNYYKNNEEIAKVAAGAHISLETAVNQFMNGNIINCMGMAMENILSRPSTCISRNSDDFVPNEAKGFREHMLQNAYNALYHDNMYACDWDMFWTNHPDARKHALVRAISGGPVYVSDRIGESIYEEIMPLVYHDGRLLRMDRCAKPTMDCIFDSPLENRACKLTNTVNGTGAIAAFHISESFDEMETKLSPSDIYDLEGEIFGAYNFLDQKFTILRREEAITVKLTEKDYALVLFLPMKDSVTPIGLINKYMSAHAVKSIHDKGAITEITIVEGGIFAFHKAQTPKRVSVNNIDYTKHLEVGNGFYRIDLSNYLQEIVVEIE
jgi:hypothetical protein